MLPGYAHYADNFLLIIVRNDKEKNGINFIYSINTADQLDHQF